MNYIFKYLWYSKVKMFLVSGKIKPSSSAAEAFKYCINDKIFETISLQFL